MLKQMTHSEADLDRARKKLHGLIETMTYVLQQAKQQGKTDTGMSPGPI